MKTYQPKTMALMCTQQLKQHLACTAAERGTPGPRVAHRAYYVGNRLPSWTVARSGSAPAYPREYAHTLLAYNHNCGGGWGGAQGLRALASKP